MSEGDYCKCHSKHVEKLANCDKKCAENRDDHNEMWQEMRSKASAAGVEKLSDEVKSKVSLKLFYFLAALMVAAIGVQVKTLAAMNALTVTVAKIETSVKMHMETSHKK